MADDIVVNPSASYTVAADVIGAVGYQRVKVQVGADGTVGDVDVTNPLPVTGAVGISGAVSISAMPAISGTVSVSNTVVVTGAVAVSGAISVSAMPAVSGTVTVNGSVAVVPGVSVVAQVSGTVSVSGPVQVSGAVSISAMPGISIVNVVPVITQASASVTGLPVWWSVGATVAIVPGVSVIASVNTLAAGFSVNALVTGPIGITVSAALGTVITILGTQIVSIVPGVSVLAQASGTVSISGTVSVVDTAINAATQVATIGDLVWLAPTQTINATVNTIAAGFSVNALVTGAVSISAMPAVSGSIAITANFAATATPGGTSTGIVAWVVPGVSVTIQQGASITGSVNILSTIPAVLAIGGITAISNLSTVVSVNNVGTMTAVLGVSAVSTVVAVQVVTAVTVVSTIVTILGNPSVAFHNTLITAATPAAGATGLNVWVVNPAGVPVGTTILTVQTILNPISVTGTSLNVVVSGPVSISAMPAVSLLTIAGTITQPAAGVTGLPIWLGPSQTVTAMQQVFTAVCFIVSSTVIGSFTTCLFTVYTGGTSVAAGTSAYAVPSGKNLRIQNMYVIAKSSAVLSVANWVMLLGTATASISFTSTAGIAVAMPFGITAATSVYQLNGLNIDIAGTTTMCPGMMGGTTCSIIGAVITGFLF